MKDIVPSQKINIEIDISAHISTREELGEYLYLASYSGKRYRGCVHIGDTMYWEWAETEEKAKAWIKKTLLKYKDKIKYGTGN